jgi:hypothetical protein
MWLHFNILTKVNQVQICYNHNFANKNFIAFNWIIQNFGIFNINNLCQNIFLDKRLFIAVFFFVYVIYYNYLLFCIEFNCQLVLSPFYHSRIPQRTSVMTFYDNFCNSSIPQSKLFCSPNHCLRFPICLYENNSTHELSYEPTEHKWMMKHTGVPTRNGKGK